MNRLESIRSIDIEKLQKYILEKLDLKNAKLGKEYFYDSLPLCVIDAVFSIGANYEFQTAPTVKRFGEKYGWQLYDPSRHKSHTINELLGLYQKNHNDFNFFAKDVFKNRQRTSTRNGILKAEAVYLFAKILSEFEIQTFDDAKSGIKRDCEVEAVIRKIPGQSSGISYKYFSMLAGSEELVKADRMICRFVAEAFAKKEPEVSVEFAEALLIAVSKTLQKQFPHINPRLLDYVIWNYQSSLKNEKTTRVKDPAHNS